MYDQTEATARMTVLPWIEMQRKRVVSAGCSLMGDYGYLDEEGC